VAVGTAVAGRKAKIPMFTPHPVRAKSMQPPYPITLKPTRRRYEHAHPEHEQSASIHRDPASSGCM